MKKIVLIELIQLLSFIVFLSGFCSLVVLGLYKEREIIVEDLSDLSDAFSNAYLFAMSASLLTQVSIIIFIITISSLIILYFSIVLDRGE